MFNTYTTFCLLSLRFKQKRDNRTDRSNQYTHHGTNEFIIYEIFVYLVIGL